MMKNIVKKNILLFTVILFLSLFSIFVYFKPNTVFDKDGSPLNFGLGYTKKTILPIWLIVIIISIISYLFILFYVNSNKFVL
jgi:hypothetical protein